MSYPRTTNLDLDSHGQNVQTTACRLAQMPSHCIAPGECDIRGWLVLADDGRRVGRVRDVIVDFLTLRLRHIEIMLDPELAEDDQDRAVIVPIVCAHVSAHRRQINLRGVTSAEIVRAPRYGSALLAPRGEAALRKFFLDSQMDDAHAEPHEIAGDASEEAEFWGVRRGGREREPYLRAIDLQ